MSFFIDHSNLKISCNILLSFCIIIVISFSFAKPATAQKQTPPPIWMQTQNAIEATQTAFAEMQIMFGLQQTQIAWSQTEEAWMQKSTEYASTMSVLNPTRTPEPSIKPTAAEQHNFNVKVGDILRFGQYEQDNNKRNGKELIEWQVLAIEDDRALLISKYALETKEYHEKDEDVTWETCSLRKWLNEDFYKKVFSYDEKSRILEIRNTNPNNPDYGTSGGKDTKDRIFLLSVEESEKYFSNTKDARCEATAYAKANGAYVVSFGYPSDGTSYCWLRTPGESMDFASCVTFYGPIKGLSYIGHWVGWYENVVRPSLWLDLTEDPGKINKIPTKTPTATIVPTNTKTPTRTPRPTATKTPTRTPRPTNGPIGGSGSGTGRY